MPTPPSGTMCAHIHVTVYIYTRSTHTHVHGWQRQGPEGLHDSLSGIWEGGENLT